MMMHHKLLCLFALFVLDVQGSNSAPDDLTTPDPESGRPLFLRAAAVVEPVVRMEVTKLVEADYRDGPPMMDNTVRKPDPCAMSDAKVLSPSKKLGTRYIMPLPSMRSCMQNVELTTVHAIWTLHNLHYGVAETYSFTDIVTNTTVSDQSNECMYKIHNVSVDLELAINTELAKYEELFASLSPQETNEQLAARRSAYDFHAFLLKLFNKLHDAHTFYATPFDMFRVYFPINFGSRMGPDGVQVVTLRTSLDKSSPLGQIALAYQNVFGRIPIPMEYNNAVITHINGMVSIDFLKQMVSDDGPLAGHYQQLEQRLNGFIFSAPLLVMAQLLSTLPEYDIISLRFEDDSEHVIKLLGQFTDWSQSQYNEVTSLRSTKSLEQYMHSNAMFESYLKLEKQSESKKSTLWKFASQVLADLKKRERSRMGRELPKKWIQMTRKHKALLDPVANLMRDNILNLIDLDDEEPSTSPVPRNRGRSSDLDDEEDFRLSYLKEKRPEGDEARLVNIIKRAMAFGGKSIVDSGESDTVAWAQVGGMEFMFYNDVIVVRIPTMELEPRFVGDESFHVFPDFVKVQQAAKEQGITRILFDVSGNQGGFVSAGYALLWYLMADESKICAPLRKRITNNWSDWIESFGDGVDSLVNRFLIPQGEALADQTESIFQDIESLVRIMFEGMGYTYDRFGGVEVFQAIERVKEAKLEIIAISSRSDRAAALIDYIRNRRFMPESAIELREQIIPDSWSCPFNPNELVTNESERLWHYKNAEVKKWGLRPAKYSKPGVFAECKAVIEIMPEIATGYEAGYWTQVAFVSDGTCGSACALLTQGLQTNGDAVAFTYGGLANTALDVAAFAGGNVERYDEFWPGLALGARLGKLASNGKAKWTVTHEESWVSSPIAFPTKARSNFNWNMMFAQALGEHALPRQFYLIPGRKHFNVWGRDEATIIGLYSEISSIADWGGIAPQFAETHGQCPLEAVPFARRQPSRVY